jgi:hypothetical protein
LTKAIETAKSPLAKYKFTQEGCEWLQKASKEKFGSNAIEVVSPGTELTSDILDKISKIKEATIDPENLVHNDPPLLEATSASQSHGKEISSSEPRKGGYPEQPAIDFQSEESKQQVAAQLASSEMKGIMKTAEGCVYEAIIDGNILAKPAIDGNALAMPERVADRAARVTEIRLKLLVVPKAKEVELKSKIGQTGTMKFGEGGTGTWHWSGAENSSLRVTSKTTFKGAVTSATDNFGLPPMNSQFEFHYEHDEKGVYACEVRNMREETWSDVRYDFRVEAARSIVGSHIWDVYVGAYSESANEYLKAKNGIYFTEGGRYIHKHWWFEAKLDRCSLGGLVRNVKGLRNVEALRTMMKHCEKAEGAGKLQYRLLKPGLHKFDKLTGQVGTETFLTGDWEGNGDTYRVDRTNVDVTFLARTTRGHILKFSKVGESGLPEAQIFQDVFRGETESRYGSLTLYALWAPRQTPTGFKVPGS